MTDPIDPKPATAAAKPVVAAKPPLDPRSRNAMRLGIVLSVLGGAALLFSMFNWWGGSARDSVSLAINGWMPGVKTTASGLQYKELVPGIGPKLTDSDVALIKYDGKLLSTGTTFDKSDQPVPMPVQGVIPGFSELLKLGSKGSKFRAWIPSKLAYGEKDTGPIPPNSTLIFEVEITDVTTMAKLQEEMMKRQMMGAMGGGAGGPEGAPTGDPTAAPEPKAEKPAPKGK